MKQIHNVLSLAKDKKDYWRIISAGTVATIPPGDWLEFGVYKGVSANIFLKGMGPNKLFLFDSWDGLPEDWGNHKKGKFKYDVPKFTDNRVKIVKGLFEHTIPQWVEKYPKPSVALVHIDCDLYSSTKCVLENIDRLITSDTLMLFDELLGTELMREHEGRAFFEYIETNGYDFEYLYRTDSMAQVALRIIK